VIKKFNYSLSDSFLDILPFSFQSKKNSEDKRILPEYRNLLRQINQFETFFSSFSDEQLRIYGRSLKHTISKTKDLSNVKFKKFYGRSLKQSTTKVFALIREVSKRILGIRLFDVQILGGLVLSNGQISEMKTGEGKTVVAMPPSYLHALQNAGGVHIITANDYLVRRDAEYTGQVHRFLGLSVGIIQEGMEGSEKKENYKCDIVYLTPSSLGFDYLYDNLAYSVGELLQRQLYYAIVDEIDSILIDQASFPLILSAAESPPTEKYSKTTLLADSLNQDIHYLVNEKEKKVDLTNAGIAFCEEFLGVSNLYVDCKYWLFYILNSLKAKELFKKNVHYIIEGTDLTLIDESTGRAAVGRRLCDGLHQALEAKENLPIKEEAEPLACISYQSLFRLYEKLSGMTATAKTEEDEFKELYNLSIRVIPTNRPSQRKDLIDMVYKTRYFKWCAIAEECVGMHISQRPVLIGTTTIENSELLAGLLKTYKIPYALLNAKPENAENEAKVIAQAGRKRAVTIATKMAGRGTDVKLGGDANFLTEECLLNVFQNEKVKNLVQLNNIKFCNIKVLIKLNKWVTNQFSEKNAKFANLSKSSEPSLNLFKRIFTSLKKKYIQIVKKAEIEVRSLGGLHIIGTERQESRRLDAQLRGRAGRQGDPGSSRFFVCLEDPLIEQYARGFEQGPGLFMSEGAPEYSTFLTKFLDRAQERRERFYFDARYETYKYTKPLDQQREIIYNERRNIFEKEDLQSYLKTCIALTLKELLKFVSTMPNYSPTEMFIMLQFQELIGGYFSMERLIGIKKVDPFIQKILRQHKEVMYEVKETEFEQHREGLHIKLEKAFILKQIDEAWSKHLRRHLYIADSTAWASYKGQDGKQEYLRELRKDFFELLVKIRHKTLYYIFRSKIRLSKKQASKSS
jgi:preprotein translocase subunit SecA